MVKKMRPDETFKPFSSLDELTQIDFGAQFIQLQHKEQPGKSWNARARKYGEGVRFDNILGSR